MFGIESSKVAVSVPHKLRILVEVNTSCPLTVALINSYVEEGILMKPFPDSLIVWFKVYSSSSTITLTVISFPTSYLSFSNEIVPSALSYVISSIIAEILYNLSLFFPNIVKV